MKFGAGQPVRRFEDDRFITGKGQYSDDIYLPHTAHMVLLRSPHAHARITGVDIGAARASKGVVGVYTHKDIDAAGLKPIPCAAVMPNRDGSPMVVPPRYALANDRVCHLGEPVAAVVAETAALARDAAELIVVDYDELPAVVDTAGALSAK